MKKPAIKTTIMTKIKNWLPDNPAESTTLTSNLSPPKPLNTNENVAAPTNIIKTIEVMYVVSLDTCSSSFQVNFFFVKARNNAPNAPTAAASVGEAIPAKMTPNTEIISTIGYRNAIASLDL